MSTPEPFEIVSNLLSSYLTDGEILRAEKTASGDGPGFSYRSHYHHPKTYMSVHGFWQVFQYSDEERALAVRGTMFPYSAPPAFLSIHVVWEEFEAIDALLDEYGASAPDTFPDIAFHAHLANFFLAGMMHHENEAVAIYAKSMHRKMMERIGVPGETPEP